MFWLRSRVNQVEQDLVKVQSELRTLRLEWEETLDKVMRWTRRHRARAEVDETASQGARGTGPYDHLDPISRQLMLERAERNGFLRQVEGDDDAVSRAG